AIMAGALLLEAKELVGHGEWLPWLRANCRVSVRQAQTYMKLARNRQKLEALKNESAAHLTVAAAEALVGRARPERSHGLPGQLDLLGGPEVTARPKAPALRDRALFDLIVDLELALATSRSSSSVTDDTRHPHSSQDIFGRPFDGGWR